MTRPDLPAPRSGGATRTPPQNLEAEESLLGAMLLSRDAIAAAAEVVQAEHFYKPAHAHVYDAILGLYGVGEPADAVTVAEELRRAGMLEVVGGPAALVALQASAPAISNAGRYARIIEELALLRRMIGAAGEIAELGYSRPDDVAKAVDSAESMIFTIAQHRAAGTTSNMRVLLEQSLDRLEQLFERGEAITGTPTGYLDLDELLSGLQPNALVVIGARPAMGKALALDTVVPTPRGWTTMGQLEMGDQVLDEQGRPTTVTYVTPVQLGRRCFEVELEDGSVLVADAEHQWSASDRPAWAATRGPGCTQVVTTAHMVSEGVASARGDRPRWYLPVALALELPEAELPVAPFLAGSRLAGCPHPGTPAPTSIPDVYLRASTRQRRALLSGLVAGAGACPAADVVELRLTDRTLLAQARELVCSLGHKAGPIRRAAPLDPTPRGAGVWRFTWSTAERASSRAVIAIRPVPSVPVRCITVDSPNSLYLVGEAMVPTHNTAFALGMATHAALHANRPSLFFSLEMSSLEITQRILCSEARVDATRMRNGKLTEADWEKISHAVGRLAEAPIWVDDNPNLTVMEIRSKARKLKSQVGDLGLVVVDYIQLMTGRNSAENRQVEVAEISRSLKILAREIETPVVALAQLNRGLEQRADKRPMLSDLRESGSLEQDADVVMFLYRDEIYNRDSAEQGIAEVIVAKHRSGPTGVARLAFLGQYTRFANMAKG